MKNITKALAMISQIGISMLVPILGCMLIGGFIDKKFDTGVLFLVIFTILGVGAAFRTLYMMTAYSFKQKNDDQNNSGHN